MLLDSVSAVGYSYPRMTFPLLGKIKEGLIRNLSALKSLNKKQILILLTTLFYLLILPLSVIAVRHEVYRASRAQFPITPPITPTPPPYVEKVDPQTGEMYDLYINSEVTTVTRTEGGPKYLASTILKVDGPRVEKIKKLFGFIQSPAIPYEPEIMEFNLQSGTYPKFVTPSINLSSNNCIDLHSAKNPSKRNYLATFCYRNTYINPGITNKRVYSYLANPFINFDYTGTKTTTIQFLTTGFDKFQNPPPYDGGNKKGIRVNYLTIDSKASSLSNFQNVVYTIQGITLGLSNEEVTALCNLGPSYPKKYLKQTPSVPKPEGGADYEVSRSSGFCTFQLDHHALIPFYLSLTKEGSIFPPTTPTPPITNHNPEIQTNNLPNGRFGKKYSTNVKAIDQNRDDSLEMSITNLPNGLNQDECTSGRSNNAWVTCKIKGEPLQAGLFNVEVYVNDNMGGSTSKILPLTIQQ